MMPKMVSYGVVGVILISFLDPPYYPYYGLLRLIVCSYSAVAAYLYFQDSQSNKGIFFALIALLFNPITPIGLDREIWLTIDVIVAALIVSSARNRDGASE